jgi:hypothetical protein
MTMQMRLEFIFKKGQNRDGTNGNNYEDMENILGNLSLPLSRPDWGSSDTA